MRGLQQGIGLRHLRTRLAQTKTQLAKKSLALAHLQPYPQLSIEELGQTGSIPHMGCQAELFGAGPQSSLDFGHLLLIQAAGTAGTLTFGQPRQTLGFETLHPVYDRVVRIAQQLRNPGAGHALSHEQNPVEPVIIARCIVAPNLILNCHDHVFFVGDS